MSEPETPESTNLPVSVERDGVILSGGSSVEALEATMERRAPATEAPSSPEPSEASPVVAVPPRDEETGKFIKPPRGARRFDELSLQAKTAQDERDAIRAEADAAKRERDELRARLDAVSRPEPVPASRPAAPEPEAKKFTFPSYEAALAQNPQLDYEDWRDERTAARVKWELDAVDINARVRQTLQAERASQEFDTSLRSVYDKAVAAYPDYPTVIREGAGTKVLLGPTVESAEARIQAIVQMPGSEHLLYAIAKDANLAQRIAQSSDLQVGQLLAQLATAPAVGRPAATGVTGFTPPPPPHSPVGTGSKTTTPSSTELAQKGSYDFDKSGYREKRAAERGVRSMK